MFIIGVDVETTGLDVKKDRIIELGYVLWDCDRSAEVVMRNNLLYTTGYPEITDEITDITGITLDDIRRWGIPPDRAFKQFLRLCEDAQYIVAHNGTNFDRPIMENEFKRAGVDFPAHHWIDTSVDVPYPKKIKTRKLVHL